MRALALAGVLSGLLGCATTAAPRTAEQPPHSEPLVRSEEVVARGLTLLDRGDYVRAEQYLQLAQQAGHPDGALILPLLRSCIASNRLRTALGHAERYLARHPSVWQVRYIRAALLRALDQPAMAKAELERVIAQAPSVVSAEDRAWLARESAL